MYVNRKHETDLGMRRRGRFYPETGTGGSRQILDQGKKQAEELVEAARKQAADDYRATLAQAEAEAGAAYDKSLAKVQKECSRMKSEARSKLPKAVEIITGKVVKSSGNC